MHKKELKQSTYHLDSNENNGSEAETVTINDYVESDSLEEDLQKAISTAERRKVFHIQFVSVYVTLLTNRSLLIPYSIN